MHFFGWRPNETERTTSRQTVLQHGIRHPAYTRSTKNTDFLLQFPTLEYRPLIFRFSETFFGVSADDLLSTDDPMSAALL
jgi:hypothetical protein